MHTRFARYVPKVAINRNLFLFAFHYSFGWEPSSAGLYWISCIGGKGKYRRKICSRITFSLYNRHDISILFLYTRSGSPSPSVSVSISPAAAAPSSPLDSNSKTFPPCRPESAQTFRLLYLHAFYFHLIRNCFLYLIFLSFIFLRFRVSFRLLAHRFAGITFVMNHNAVFDSRQIENFLHYHLIFAECSQCVV